MLSRRDDGFTLVELLVAISVLGLLLSAITGSIFVGMRTAARTEDRLTESNDELTATGYFADDVQGAKSVTVSTVPKCGTDASAVVEFVGQDFADTATPAAATPDTVTTVVSYVLRTRTGSTGTTRELHRLACTAPAASPAYPLTPVTDVAVVGQLVAAAPVVNCGSVACSAFVQVNLVLTADSGSLTYTLTGRRRTTP